MARFASRKVVYVTLEGCQEDKPADGEWIAVRASLNLAQRTQLQAAVIGIEDNKPLLKMGPYLTAFNEMALVDWHLLDGEGRPVPFEREKIGELDPTDPLVDAAMREFAERNPMSQTQRRAAGG